MTGRDGDLTVERSSDRELVVTRIVAGPARLVFQAWASPELFQRWWLPVSCGMTVVAFEADVRTGGSYRLELGHPASDQPMAFFGRYVEVVSGQKIVWTNEEGDEDGPVTTVTFEDRGEKTLVRISDLYPSKALLDEAIDNGSTSGWGEQLLQLEAVVGEFSVKALCLAEGLKG